mmetsp:Transcript_12477/g.34398  ORF Transcript_12477/g.34398 Transcript_12477/m.34398 type:complete len:201 (+) Transcript_12477:2378-2980(+)
MAAWAKRLKADGCSSEPSEMASDAMHHAMTHAGRTSALVVASSACQRIWSALHVARAGTMRPAMVNCQSNPGIATRSSAGKVRSERRPSWVAAAAAIALKRDSRTTPANVKASTSSCNSLSRSRSITPTPGWDSASTVALRSTSHEVPRCMHAHRIATNALGLAVSSFARSIASPANTSKNASTAATKLRAPTVSDTFFL